MGLGTAAACAERGCLVIGVDADWYLTAPEFNAITLTSILKNMDVAVLNTITNVVNLGAVGNLYVGTLANGGVGLAPYHDLEAHRAGRAGCGHRAAQGGHHRRRRPGCLPGSARGVAEGDRPSTMEIPPAPPGGSSFLGGARPVV